MRNFILILIVAITLGVISCTRTESRQKAVIAAAAGLMHTDADSAVKMLDAVDPSELYADSLRAEYHYLKAYGHMLQNRSMIADSLISYAYGYFRGKDIVRDMRSGAALAWYRFWVGDTPGAINLLDSLTGRDDVPDSLMVPTLRLRVMLGASEYQGRRLIPLARRLMEASADTMGRLDAGYMLLCAYENAEEYDSALMIADELVGYAYANRWGDKQFVLELERAQILTEMGLNSESDSLITRIFSKAGPDNGAADFLHMQRAVNALNTGRIALASRELGIADSLATRLRQNGDDVYYRSLSNLMHAMIDFSQTGRLRLAHVTGLNNRQRERYNRMEASQWESERGALRQQSRALALKAESEHKTVLILVIALVAVVLLAAAALMIRHRRQRERENEERAEALQKMVDELKSAPAVQQAAEETPAALRRAMLQQLGIIKMVAETPTEQNREMLRKISSMEGETGGSLVNWDNLFELINNLYGGFYDRLHGRYGDVLSVREEQIIVLMVAGFSTKEISVITGQTASTIYVRKSSVRKKLGTTGKEDIVAFLRQELSC